MVKIFNLDASRYEEMLERGFKCDELGSDEDTVNVQFVVGIIKLNTTCRCLTIDQGGKIFTLDSTEFYKVEMI